MLYTNLNHIETAAQYHEALQNYTNVMVICGRMGEYSIPVYRVAEALQKEYSQVEFFDMEYNNPELKFVQNLFDDYPGANIPFLLYYINGEMVYHGWGIKTKDELESIINQSIAI
jgi:thioredoxin 1